MIGMIYDERRIYCFRFVCDHCHKTIEGDGAAVWRADVNIREGEMREVLHAHKGRCHERVEEKLGGRIPTGWTELCSFVDELVENTHLDRPEDWRKRRK